MSHFGENELIFSYEQLVQQYPEVAGEVEAKSLRVGATDTYKEEELLEKDD